MDSTKTALGVFLLIAGMGVGFWGMSMAGNMTLGERLVYEEEYDSYQAAMFIGFLLAAVGAAVAVYGLEVKETRDLGGSKWPLQTSHQCQTHSLPTVQEHAKQAYCGNCGGHLLDGSRFCTACGKTIESDRFDLRCPSCGVDNPRSAQFCYSCGTRTR